jgi:hypothetical protein
MDVKLQIGQVVWAKVRGYAWWPGVVRVMQVSEIKQEEDSGEGVQSAKITVHFIGENSQ